VGHDKVHDQHVNSEAARKDVYRLLSVACFDNDVAALPEYSCDDLADYVVVLNHEDDVRLSERIRHLQTVARDFGDRCDPAPTSPSAKWKDSETRLIAPA
jgi:hypothetical protein